MRLADPRPAYCSACFNSSDAGADKARRFVDFEAAWDGPMVLNPDGTIVVAPNGEPCTNDDLYLCDQCVATACELLGVKPQLSANQLREIKRLELENRHWRGTAKRLQAELDEQLNATLEPSVGQRRKIAA